MDFLLKYVKSLGCESWPFHLVVFVPLILAGAFANHDTLTHAAMMFFSFSLMSSAVFTSEREGLLPFLTTKTANNGSAANDDSISWPEAAGLAFGCFSISLSIAWSVSEFAFFTVIFYAVFKLATIMATARGMSAGAASLASVGMPLRLLAGGPAIGVALPPLVFISLLFVAHGVFTAFQTKDGATKEAEGGQIEDQMQKISRHILAMALLAVGMSCYAIFLATNPQPLLMFTAVPAAYALSRIHAKALASGDRQQFQKSMISDAGIGFALAAWTLIIIATVMFPPK